MTALPKSDVRPQHPPAWADKDEVPGGNSGQSRPSPANESPEQPVVDVASTPSGASETTPQTGEVHELGNISVAHVPAGEFEMGSDDGRSNEKPVHKVDLDGY